MSVNCPHMTGDNACTVCQGTAELLKRLDDIKALLDRHTFGRHLPPILIKDLKAVYRLAKVPKRLRPRK